LADVDPGDSGAPSAPREAQIKVTEALDEAMAAAVLTEGSTIRQTATLAGLTENAVGPRLARTSLLAAYRDGDRVTRTGVERARYDLEEGRHKVSPPTPDDERPPLRPRVALKSLIHWQIR
jgi:hypothetical protein